jgi:transposase
VCRDFARSALGRVCDNAGMGRPSKLTEDRKSAIIDSLRAGNYLETAAAGAGVHRDTLNEWRKQFPDFSDAVEKARAEAEEQHVAVIRAAARDSWQAAAWWLERSYPHRWGRRDRVYQSVVGSVEIKLAFDPTPDPGG